MSEPQGRDHAVDALRALAILGVVLGHWLVTAFVADGPAHHLRVTSPLKAMPELAPLSWVFQTLAVFFFVGGYSAARGLRPGEPWTPRLRRRLVRLARPLPVLVLAWVPVAVALSWAGFPADSVRTLIKLVLSPLWFLCVYVALTALTPLVAAAWNRLGLWGAVLLTGATAAIDLGRFPSALPAGRDGPPSSPPGSCRSTSASGGRTGRCARAGPGSSCWPGAARRPPCSSCSPDTRRAWSASPAPPCPTSARPRSRRSRSGSPRRDSRCCSTGR
ncbi:acyltransferase [Actinomadura madurae]|uniref:acyltransferase family protein n=1 Tax=Actinomadura madurae TaxID=1993 RepID=UPI0020D23580|nr:acyltransferase [Actinomadura madurae]MCP9949389.1 acyltransferase [Actinomadura madurae]MCP9966144.1 acyltransferase [Actinomadura madurae]MCQ0009845.1 acyltransferase [Actinomadura madurae]MCQ0014830.1 acyltransferase [Actinomadura madurae]